MLKLGMRVIHENTEGVVDRVNLGAAHIKYDHPRKTNAVCGCHKDGHEYEGAWVGISGGSVYLI
jgi:hypothetical protein